MNKRVKAERGITLIALVVTIVVLIILASISIATLTGENGIITKAIEAAKRTKEAEEEELKKLEEIKIPGEDNEEDGTLIIKTVDSNSREVVAGAICELYDNQYKLIKTIDMTTNGIYDGSADNLSVGTYYVSIIDAPKGYNVPAQSYQFKIIEQQQNIWEIELDKGYIIPGKAPGIGAGDGSDDGIIDYSREVSMRLDDVDNMFAYETGLYNLYEIATFNTETSKYEYIDPLKNKGLGDISLDSFYDYGMANRIARIVENNEEPIILNAPMNSVQNGLRKDRCYIIIPEEVINEKEIIRYKPLILPFASFYGYEIILSWRSHYEVINRMINIEIANIVSNEQIRGEEIFVFSVKGYNSGEEAFSRIVNIPMKIEPNNREQKASKQIELPLVDEIIVEEIYSGASFIIASDAMIQENTPEDGISFSFSNVPKFSTPTGSSVAHLFTYTDSEEWSWKVTNTINSGITVIDSNPPANWSINSKVKMKDDDDNRSYYVRIKAFSEVPLALIDDEGKWTLNEDGYYHYEGIVKSGELTDAFNIAVETNDGYDSPNVGDEIDLIIISEVTKVRYEDDGTAYADWTSDINE